MHRKSTDKISARLTEFIPKQIHTYHLTALFPGLAGWAGTRNVKPIWILLEQETVSGSGISWAICKSAPRSRQITTPTPHRSVFLQAGCPSCRQTNSVKALKAKKIFKYSHKADQNHTNYYSCKCSVNIQMKIQLHYCATESNQNYGMSRASLICFNIISRHNA